ncbi:D-alanyl-D-alanine carboxypeptidase family protein [Allokutzneria oryzae]|uniref:D-alanyl-D-alanine carboxypeptidase family protein n=1 Tax=Allokutzneria oryzae TaxID=1378989 RepID=A0ABV5ZQ39_9PSEU
MRTTLTLLVTLLIAVGALFYIGPTTPVPGVAYVELVNVTGDDTGPTCPLDQRYVDEAPRGLRDDVLAAWNTLKAKAAAEGVSMCLNDGKRSSQQQQAEFDGAVRRFGSAEQASKYVLTPEASNHVKGIAADIQPLASASWVERGNGKFGWCRRYQNEPWHFEYDPSYVNGCPPMLPNALASR